MGKRKQYTIRATITKKDPTKAGFMIKDKVMHLYLDKLIQIASKK